MPNPVETFKLFITNKFKNKAIEDRNEIGTIGKWMTPTENITEDNTKVLIAYKIALNLFRDDIITFDHLANSDDLMKCFKT